jgi:diguanylate cyclase (GGDEF)-like protein
MDQYVLRSNTLLEPMTTWNETVAQVHKPKLDLEVIDGGLGTYLYTAAGEEEAYILNARDEPIYAAIEGRHAPLSAFDSERRVFLPMVRELRAMMREPKRHLLPKALTPGVLDRAIVHGHPAMVVVKPIVAVDKVMQGRAISNAHVIQKPGEEYIHILIRRLDSDGSGRRETNGVFLAHLRNDFLFKDIRFSWTDTPRAGEMSHPIKSPRTGQVLGYYLWRPFMPGTVVLRDMILPLLVGLLVVTLVTWLLLRRIRRSTAELQASEAQAKHLAFHDVLTGLPNRALFDDRLDRGLATARRHPEREVALLCLDVDRFKQVNDTLGHPAGDELIREVARRLRGVVRENDTVARLGGDEFAIIQTEVVSPRNIELLCDRILAAINEPFEVVGQQVFVGMSIGVARSGTDGYDRTELARKADIALYRAKIDGRGRYRIFATDMDANVQIRQSIEQDLRAALEKGGELEVYYQPKYDVKAGGISGVEALVRWHHPLRGLICPSVFVPIAEECGLIEALGEWVLKEACLAARPLPIDSVSVNISAVQLRNPFFAHRVVKILHETGVDPRRLELEITETSFLDNVEQCQANLKMLRTTGIRISLDDFGTGYSSFSHLRDYEVDRLKIDRSFTSSIQESPEGSAIISAIIALARSIGLKVTAEGVETAEQSQFLSSAGCDELQGFLMSAAIPLPELDKLLGIDPAVRHEAQKQGLAA